jgi:hypothetical protein
VWNILHIHNRNTPINDAYFKASIRYEIETWHRLWEKHTKFPSIKVELYKVTY